MKYMQLFDRLLAKYGASTDTLKVPTGDYEPGRVPPAVVEIPSAPRVPIFNDPPSYEDVHIDSPGRIPPERALAILISRCDETGLFSTEELVQIMQLKTKGTNVAFKELIHQIRKKEFAAETCLQILKNMSVHFV
jgi:hypothetical protein